MAPWVVHEGCVFRIERPTAAHVSAVYGFDAGMRGYFVEVLRGRKVTRTYDPLTAGYAVARPLWGALVFLVVEGFFTESELHEALLALDHAELDALRGAVRRVAEVVTHFKAASD